MAHKILFIDDDAMVRQTFTDGLRAAGFTVVSALNGMEGLQKISKAKPDIVVTDIIMPDTDGLNTIREIRKRYKALPIIAVSGGGRTHNMEFLGMAKQIGADATLAKPFRISALVEVIHRLLREKASDS
ncbi:response regulator [Thalassospira lucentensis]|uniref:response regulator transcription factor n=1 Tax=Thalassospira lucentensis TaxID=168935 RepID=UPI0029437F80|nr:response regulator [Thalassospira lucentensis]WOI09607.1 response regulator [Thalassospira lucentensis]